MNMLNFLSRLPGESNNNYSYRAIKEGILSLELLPGQLLSIGELTESLKVSSTPIKIALWKLQQEHLVDVIPQVGSYTSKIDVNLVKEAASMWFDLEKGYLKSACKYFSGEHVNQLKRNIKLQDILLEQKHGFKNPKTLAKKFNELDDHFHSFIFQSHQRNNTWQAISHMTVDYHRIMMLMGIENHMEKMIAEHKEILSIIENKEINRVECVLRSHIFNPIESWAELDKKLTHENMNNLFTEPLIT